MKVARRHSQNYLLFVAGWPASGKSYFGNWLEYEKNFLHIDAEKEKGNRLHELGIDELWKDAVMTNNSMPFAAELRLYDKSIIFNWGFSVQYLTTASALKRSGFSSWWFNADEDQARSEFNRMGKSLKAFDIQVSGIKSILPQILELFAPNIVTTLSPTGKRLSPELIWSIIKNHDS